MYELLCKTIPCLSVWTAAVREDTHARVEHPDHPLVRVPPVSYPGSAAHPIDPGDSDTPLNILLTPVLPSTTSLPALNLTGQRILSN